MRPQGSTFGTVFELRRKSEPERCEGCVELARRGHVIQVEPTLRRVEGKTVFVVVSETKECCHICGAVFRFQRFALEAKG